MSTAPYWRPIEKFKGKRLPIQVKEALRQYPAYVNNRAFWCGLYIALDEDEAIEEVINFIDNNPAIPIEVINE